MDGRFTSRSVYCLVVFRPVTRLTGGGMKEGRVSPASRRCDLNKLHLKGQCHEILSLWVFFIEQHLLALIDKHINYFEYLSNIIEII
jgi:hypothetical protein